MTLITFRCARTMKRARNIPGFGKAFVLRSRRAKMKFYDSLSVFSAWFFGDTMDELESVAEIKRISQIYRTIFHAFEWFCGLRLFYCLGSSTVFWVDGSKTHLLTFCHGNIWRVVGNLVAVLSISTIAQINLSFWIPSSRIQTSRTVMINV